MFRHLNLDQDNVVACWKTLLINLRQDPSTSS